MRSMLRIPLVGFAWFFAACSDGRETAGPTIRDDRPALQTGASGELHGVPAQLSELVQGDHERENPTELVILHVPRFAGTIRPSVAHLSTPQGEVLKSYSYNGDDWRASSSITELPISPNDLLPSPSSCCHWPVPMTTWAPWSGSGTGFVSTKLGEFAFVSHPYTWSELQGLSFTAFAAINDGIKEVEVCSGQKERWDVRGAHKLTLCGVWPPSFHCGPFPTKCKWPAPGDTGLLAYPPAAGGGYNMDVKYWSPPTLSITAPGSASGYTTVNVAANAKKGAGETSPVNGYFMRWEYSFDGVSYTQIAEEFRSNGVSNLSIPVGQPGTLFLRARSRDLFGHEAHAQTAISIVPPPPVSVVLQGRTNLATA
jgi:hypothetical protein